MQRFNKLLSAILILFTLTIALILGGCNEDKLDINAIGVLDGTVMDFSSEINLSGAVLTTNPPSVSVASDSAGYFEFKTIEVGDYNLIAKKNGYVSESVSVSVSKIKRLQWWCLWNEAVNTTILQSSEVLSHLPMGKLIKQ